MPFATSPANRLTGAALMQAISGKRLTYVRESVRTPGAWVNNMRDHRPDGSFVYLCEFGRTEAAPGAPATRSARRKAGRRLARCRRVEHQERNRVRDKIGVRRAYRRLHRHSPAGRRVRRGPPVGAARGVHQRHHHFEVSCASKKAHSRRSIMMRLALAAIAIAAAWVPATAQQRGGALCKDGAMPFEAAAGNRLSGPALQQALAGKKLGYVRDIAAHGRRLGQQRARAAPRRLLRLHLRILAEREGALEPHIFRLHHKQASGAKDVGVWTSRTTRSA